MLAVLLGLLAVARASPFTQVQTIATCAPGTAPFEADGVTYLVVGSCTGAPAVYQWSAQTQFSLVQTLPNAAPNAFLSVAQTASNDTFLAVGSAPSVVYTWQQGEFVEVQTLPKGTTTAALYAIAGQID